MYCIKRTYSFLTLSYRIITKTMTGMIHIQTAPVPVATTASTTTTTAILPMVTTATISPMVTTTGT